MAVRHCPDCRIPLIEIGLDGEQVDRCPQCSGIFFDRGELESIVQLFRCYQKVTLGEPEIDTIPRAEIERQVLCPADGTPMNPADGGEMIYDTCPACDGIWLDSGELSVLRATEAHIRRNIGLYIRLGN